MNNTGIAWFARNPVAANLMMVLIIVSGLIATTTVKEEVFPEIQLDRISIQVPYLGAAPEEVENGVGIKPAAETLGLTLQHLGNQVRQAFYGEEAQRIQRGRDDIRVMVRYPRDDRRSLGDLENMRIRTPNGGEVPFSQVAQVEPGRGFASIQSPTEALDIHRRIFPHTPLGAAGRGILDKLLARQRLYDERRDPDR